MGRVYLAEHAFTTRLVALKLLTSQAGPVGAKRLLREARILGTLRHPYIVEVIDAGTSSDGEPFMAMEMLDGRPLDGILATRQRLSISEALLVALQMCQALVFVHNQGIAHRDLKPANVFIAHSSLGKEAIRLLDFGIAGYPDDPLPTEEKLTMAGEVLGTPEYMAPEQLLAEPTVDHRVDLYAVGVILYECLTGDVPYPGTYPQVMLKVATAAAPNVTAARPDVPPQVARIVERALQRKVSARYQKATDMVAEIDAALRALVPAGSHRALSLLTLVSLPPAELPDLTEEAEPVPERKPPPLPPAALAAQRRRFTRAPYVAPVLIELADGSTVEGRSEDISEGGMLVLVGGPFASSEAVQVSFALPASGSQVETRATARWVKEAHGGRGAVGLEFAGLTATERADIAQYVRRLYPAG